MPFPEVGQDRPQARRWLQTCGAWAALWRPAGLSCYLCPDSCLARQCGRCRIIWRGAHARVGHVGEGEGCWQSIGLVKDQTGVPELSMRFQAEPCCFDICFIVLCRYYNWTTAAPLLLAMQAFQKPLPKVSSNMKKKNDGQIYLGARNFKFFFFKNHKVNYTVLFGSS